MLILGTIIALSIIFTAMAIASRKEPEIDWEVVRQAILYPEDTSDHNIEKEN
jgi:hypothetical protein